MIYINKLLILAQDVMVRICSKVNDDKMVKNPLKMSMKKIQRRWTEESVAAGWWWWKFKYLGVSGLSSMWHTNPYNLSHLCSAIFKVLLPFLWNTTEHSCGILKTFLSVKDLPVDSTQLYVQELYVCVITNLMVILIFGQVFHQEMSGSVWSSRKMFCLIFFKVHLSQPAVCC